MEIWLDTAHVKTIKDALRYGIIYGITTNPSLLAAEKDNPEKILTSALDLHQGPLAVQITSEEAHEIQQRAQVLHQFSKRIIVKIPVTPEGLIAMKSLTQQGIPVMATAVYHPKQALLASAVGAKYVAPYVGRMFDEGIEAYTSLHTMVKILEQSGSQTKIIAAALRTVDQILTCAEMGVEAVTLKPTLFQQLIETEPLTRESLRSFSEDWDARACKQTTALVL